ncbi:MAG: hypothetical protein K2M90_01990 [Treponemataceae bacterium]|nr:hypothetical protein [Treponemataceae bacterium]MDE7391225.1 hypothetical protein [Treponemataceae bacterium]
MNNRKTLVAAIAAIVLARAAFAAEKHYNIGDIGPGGGYVFYYSEEGFPVYESDSASPVICHYLECSQIGLEGISWCPCTHDGYGASDSEFKKLCNINTTDGVGAGKLNTAHIVKFAHRKSLTPANCAAYACLRYFTEATKEGEWYLPSEEELDLIYKNLVKSEKISNGTQWSSVHRDRYCAYWHTFSSWSENPELIRYDTKYERHCVRPVRAF